MKNEMKNKDKSYHVVLHVNGFKYTNKFSGFDSACAHFRTPAKIGTITFEEAKQEAIELIGGQQVSHGWVDYTVGKLFVENGQEPVSVMSPAWEYRTPASSTNTIWKEVK
tara:strand:- start:38 stop:367 length:330 start_codon:yes stop_codon:yes gene_type:complete